MFSDWSMLIKMGMLQIMYTHIQRITKQTLPKLKKKKKKPQWYQVIGILMILSPTLVVLHLSFQSSSLFFSTLLWSPQILVHMDASLVGSLVAQMVKNLLAMQETWVRSLGWEDPQRREWLSTPVFLPGESHGQRSLASYSQWGHKESDTTE